MTIHCPPIMALLLLSLLASQAEAFRVTVHPSTSSSSSTALFDEKKPPKPTWYGDKGVPSYSDDWLLNFHNTAQNEKQTTTNSLVVWNEQQDQETADIREWQEAFARNGLADFTPPMSFGLNCLMVGQGIETGGAADTAVTANTASAAPKETKLPWEEEAEADITSLEVVIPEKMTPSGELPEARGRIQTRLVTDNPAPAGAAGLRVSSEAAVYDCIVDQGLLGAVLLADDCEETVKELCLEASLALREHGIYVLNTKQLTPATIELLESFGQEAGLEWQFRLDGISDDNAQVSVARRFNNGKMPKFEKLSRYQPY